MSGSQETERSRCRVAPILLLQVEAKAYCRGELQIRLALYIYIYVRVCVKAWSCFDSEQNPSLQIRNYIGDNTHAQNPLLINFFFLFFRLIVYYICKQRCTGKRRKKTKRLAWTGLLEYCARRRLARNCFGPTFAAIRSLNSKNRLLLATSRWRLSLRRRGLDKTRDSHLKKLAICSWQEWTPEHHHLSIARAGLACTMKQKVWIAIDEASALLEK